jgi:hypothetical protein
MSTYRRSTNDDFNIQLAKQMTDRQPSNVERSQANVDKWLADEAARKLRGEQSDFVQAVQRNLDEYNKPHGNVWWAWTIVKNRVYRIWVEIVRRGE